MSKFDTIPANLRLDLEYDVVNVPPTSVNSTLVSSFGGDLIIDCLFLSPFTVGRQLKSSGFKGFDDNSSKSGNPLKVKVLPVTRIVMSPSSAMALMKQIQETLEFIGISYEDQLNSEEVEEND
jgi:hypothetical protein